MGKCISKHKPESEDGYLSMVKDTEHKNSFQDEWPDPSSVDSVPFKDHTITVFVYEVYDGDTFSILINLGKGVFTKLNLRLLGADAPEMKVKGKKTMKGKDLKLAELEERAAEVVRDKVRTLIKGKECEVILKKWDKYGGRVVGVVLLSTHK